MKISRETLKVLQNMGIISNSIYVDEAKILKVRSVGSIVAVYDTEEEFPEFGIYNLSEFIGVINLFGIESVDFEFEESLVNIISGGTKIRYMYCDKEMIPMVKEGKVKHSEKYKNFTDFDGSFLLSENDITKIKTASSILSLGDIEINITNGVGKLKMMDNDNPLTNTVEVDIIGEGSASIYIGIDKLQFYPGEYLCSVKSKTCIKFQHNKIPLFYIIPANAKKK